MQSDEIAQILCCLERAKTPGNLAETYNKQACTCMCAEHVCVFYQPVDEQVNPNAVSQKYYGCRS